MCVRKSLLILTSLALLFSAVSVQAAIFTHSDDFESYGAFAATANNGNKWFYNGAPDDDGSYAAGGWMDYYGAGNGALAEPLQISAPGGPHVAGNPSGYLNTIGLTNFDATNQKGVAHALPAVPNLGAGDVVELSILVNLSAQAGPGKSYLHIGDSDLIDGAGGLVNFAGVSMNNNGTGEMRQGSLGPEPGISLPGTDTGWQEVKLRVFDAFSVPHGQVTTQMEVLSGPVGGPLVSRGSYSASFITYTPTHYSLSPNLGSTFDNVSVSVIEIPEPASLSLLALGSSLIVLRRRRA